ncbi:MAG TPA: thermonuclease family protein [Kamptonema sp.]|nr:thermonuclease family protein [Kamptonema sp.]
MGIAIKNLDQTQRIVSKVGEKVVYCLLAIAFCLFLVSCEEPPEKPSGSTVKVEGVITGQSIEIAGFADQTPILEQVRLIGIEAPDLKQQPWGPEARQKLEQLIGGQQVLLESDAQDKDRYDRKLAYLWRGEILLNEQLVKEGYALVVARSPNTKYKQRLANAQEWARLMGRGIWNPEAPMRQTPAEFRNQNRK